MPKDDGNAKLLSGEPKHAEHSESDGKDIRKIVSAATDMPIANVGAAMPLSVVEETVGLQDVWACSVSPGFGGHGSWSL